MADGVHLHLDDYPATLELLSALLAHKHADVAAIGYAATEHGATVDWDRLEHSWLSSTERAVVHLARGCAILERGGGCPERLADVVVDVVTSVVSGDREPASPLQNVTNAHDLRRGHRGDLHRRRSRDLHPRLARVMAGRSHRMSLVE